MTTIEKINQDLQNYAPGFQVVGSKDCTVVELLYKRSYYEGKVIGNLKQIERPFELTNYFLTTRKYNYPNYMNIKLDLDNNITEIYPSVLGDSIKDAIPTSIYKVINYGYKLKPNTCPYVSWDVKKRLATHFYCVPNFVNSTIFNKVEESKCIFRESIPHDEKKRLYLQLNYSDIGALNYHHNNFKFLEECPPEYVIAYFREKEQNGQDLDITNDVVGIIAGYNPFNENYEKAIVNINL